jgi:1,4-alpha-glucan branching enzyme
VCVRACVRAFVRECVRASVRCDVLCCAALRCAVCVSCGAHELRSSAMYGVAMTEYLVWAPRNRRCTYTR